MPQDPRGSPSWQLDLSRLPGGPGGPIDDLLDRLSHAFFQIVPLALRTHCLLTSRIVQTVLEAFGVEAVLVPCQLVYAQPARQIVIGFTGALGALPDRWDGHVVCTAGGKLIDAATYAFEERFGAPSPFIVVVPRVEGVQTSVIARADLAHGNSLWWLAPPVAADVSLPAPAADEVQTHARRLILLLRGAAMPGPLQGPRPGC